MPVAIINDSYGGTPIQGWMPVEALKKGSWSQDRWNDQALAKAEYDKKKEALQPAMDKVSFRQGCCNSGSSTTTGIS